MGKALDLANLLIKHAQAAFGLMERDQATADADFIWKWLRNNPSLVKDGLVKRTDVHTALHGRFQRVERLVKALECLQAANVLSASFKLQTRKPTIVYQVNPKALEG
jgi:hypothetical protein